MIGAQQPIGVTPEELMSAIGYKGKSPTLPSHIEAWVKAESLSRKNAPKDGKTLEKYLNDHGIDVKTGQRIRRSTSTPSLHQQHPSSSSSSVSKHEALNRSAASHISSNSENVDADNNDRRSSSSSKRQSQGVTHNNAAQWDDDEDAGSMPSSADEQNIEAELEFRSSL
jgi:hypothetical protein